MCFHGEIGMELQFCFRNVQPFAFAVHANKVTAAVLNKYIDRLIGLCPFSCI